MEAKSFMKMPNKQTMEVLLNRKAWLIEQIEQEKQNKALPWRKKNYLHAEFHALTRVIDFVNMMFKYIPDKQFQEILCQYDKEMGSESCSGEQLLTPHYPLFYSTQSRRVK